MSDMNKNHFNDIIKNDLPWAFDLGMHCKEISNGTATLELRYTKKMLRPGGTISGPTMMALADATMYAVVLGAIGAVKLAVTTSFNINFLSRPKANNLEAHGLLLKQGKRLIVIETKIFTVGVDHLVAHATGTYSVPRR